MLKTSEIKNCINIVTTDHPGQTSKIVIFNGTSLISMKALVSSCLHDECVIKAQVSPPQTRCVLYLVFPKWWHVSHMKCMNTP